MKYFFFGHCMQFHWGNYEISIYKLTPGTVIRWGPACVSPRSGDRLPSFTGGNCSREQLATNAMYFLVDVELGLGLF